MKESLKPKLFPSLEEDSCENEEGRGKLELCAVSQIGYQLMTAGQ